MADIRLEGVTKTFGEVPAASNISLEVGDGEFVCLLGPSGAGKSTILRLIAGLEEPDAGRIYIGSQLVNNLAPRHRNVALVFQSYALYPHKTVYDNLAFPLRAEGLARDEIDRRVRQAAELLNISSLLKRLPGQLSGGERQRVAIGRAFVRQPKAYLMDEPLTNLDAKLRVLMRTEMKRLQKEVGGTTLMATPDQMEAMTLADRIVLLDQGRIIQCDTPHTIYYHPDNRLAATLTGSPPMNLIRCTVLQRDGHILLDAGEFTWDASSLSKVLQGVSSKNVDLGVRAEHVKLTKPGQVDRAFEAKVYVVEPTKPEVTVHLEIGGLRLAALAPPHESFEMGQSVWVTFDSQGVRLFEADTGKALT